MDGGKVLDRGPVTYRQDREKTGSTVGTPVDLRTENVWVGCSSTVGEVEEGKSNEEYGTRLTEFKLGGGPRAGVRREVGSPV